MRGIIGLLLLLLGIVFKVLETVLKIIFGGSSSTTTASNEKFRIRVTNDRFDGDEFSWDVFKAEMRGSISAPYDNFRIKLVMQILDVTDGKEEVVFCTYENFQESINSEVFWFESESFLLPYKDTIYPEWSQVVKIPKMLLVFPRKGSRELRFKVYVVNDSNGNILEQSTTKISYQNPDNGYKDSADNTKYFEEMVVKASMLVSASDGNMDASEAKVVTGWIQKRLSRYGEKSQSGHKDRLNSYIKEVYQEIQNGDANINDILDGIENIASEGDKFELFQVCLDVAQADGEADKAELDMIHSIANYIDLDERQFKSMIEKTLPITMHAGEAQTPESIIGITDDMTITERKRHLGDAYKKWNQRVANKDPGIREQANRMIEIIVELRKKYS